MKIDFRTIANDGIRTLSSYQPGKTFDELNCELGLMPIKLSSNENPLGASDHVIAACQSALAKSHIYPDQIYRQLKAKLAQFFAVQPEQISLGNGSENILELIIKSYLKRELNAVISQYTFLTIPLLLQSYDVHAKVIPARDFGHDTEAMLKAIDENTRLLFLVNPNNPTGTYTNSVAFEKLLASIPSHVIIVVDEAYCEYIDKQDYPRTLDYLSRYPNLIIVRTFSKIYGLAGLRLGYSISSPDIADMLNRARLPYNVNSMAAMAACAALDDQAHIRASIMHNMAGMKQLIAGLDALTLMYIPSIANFITIDVGDAQTVYQQLLSQGIIVRPLTIDGMPKHIRVTIGTQEQNKCFLSALATI